MGPIIDVQNYDLNISKDRNNEYAFLFYLKKNTEKLKLDEDKKIGLIIYDNGVDYYVDLKENKNYDSFSDLVEEFYFGFFYVIGKKK